MENEKTFEERIQEILDLVSEKKYIKARDALIEMNNAVDVAEALEEVMEHVGLERAVILFRSLPKELSVDVFSYMPIEDQISIINTITDKEISFILEELDFDDMIDVLEELPANVVDKILEKTPKEERKRINTFLNYPEGSAGTLMTPEYISLRQTMTVEEALAYIKKESFDSETIYTCYVKDNGRKLVGIISLRSLVISEGDTIIEDIMQQDFVSVNVHDDQEVVSEVFKRYGFLAIPVVDNESRLVGIVTVDDIFEVIEEEATEDFERMAGVLDSSHLEYLDASVFSHVKSRFPWLLFLMISLMVTGLIISRFEGMLSQVIILVAYLPLLMGTGGNSGSQAATVIIRGLATGEIELKDGMKVLWKELRISLAVGVLLSAMNFVKVIFLDGESVLIALTISLSLLLIIFFAKLIGGMLPLLAKKCKIDPALMATPMIASMTDMVSVVTYFLLATLILGL
ncbi:MAG TPA: magnesium transporter [Bacillota bacterium]|jgi:magnesium transporter|nr:magnesium transporter [Bacillota bacterium]